MIRIAIGTELRTEIARKVLEHSILKFTKSPIEFHSIFGEDFKERGLLGQGTGFSFLRFSLPEYFNYQGYAIYLDADMLVLSDIKKLWNYQDNSKNIVWCKLGNEEAKLAETSVMLINCEMAKNKMFSLEEINKYLENDEGRIKYRKIMKLQYLNPQPTEISRWWNVMDKGCLYSKIKDFHSPKANLLHFTDIKNQPWFNPNHSAAKIWGLYFREAFKLGKITKEEVLEAVNRYDYSNPKRPNGLHSYWISYLGL